MLHDDVLLGVLIAVLLLGPAWLTFLRQHDAWPFSHYPMFSQAVTAATLRVYRIALETEQGLVLWWEPHFAKLQQQLGQQYARTMVSGQPPDAQATARFLHRLRHYVNHEVQPPQPFVAICIVERSLRRTPDGQWEPSDRVVYRAPAAPVDNPMTATGV